jgi:hypothetical protein
MPFIATAIGAVIGAIGTAAAAIGSFITGLGFLGQALVGIGLNVAAALIRKANQKKPIGGVSFDRQYGADVPRQVAIGPVGVAGHDCYVNTYGRSNKLLQQIYVVSDFYCDGMSRVAINGTWATLGSTADPDKGFPVTSGDFANKIWIKFFDGTQTSADQYLIDNANPSDRWSSSHVGLGLAFFLVSMTYDSKKNNQFPEFFFEFRGARLYDWRKDSTNGGSGSHRWGDYSTYEYTTNPIVADYNYRRGFTINGDLFCGMEMDASDLPLDKYTAAAAICGESVSLDGGGSEARYQLSMLIDCTATHGDNVEAIMLACGGMVIDGVDGSWPLVGSDQPSVATITDDDFVTGAPFQFRAKRSMAEIVNSVSGNSPDPGQLWSMVGYEAQISDAALVVDRRTRDVNIDFPQVPSLRQAAQLASIYLEESRWEATASGTLRPRWQVLEPGDWITWDSAKYGTRTMMISEAALASLDADGPRNAQISLQQRDGSIYDGILNPVVIVPIGSGAAEYQSELVNFAVTGVIGEASTGSKRAGIRATWDLIDDPTIIAVDLEYGPISATGAAPAATALASQDDETATIDLWQGVMSKALFAVRYRLRSEPPRTFFWSGWVEVTTDQAGFGTDDILDGAITELKVAAQAISTAKLQIAAVTADILSPNSVTNTKIADAALTVSKFAADITPVQIVDTLPASGTMVGQTVYNTGDGQLYTWNGTSWDTSTATVADGSITAVKLAEAAVTASKLASGAVTHDAIAAGSVYGDVIAAQSITARELILTDFNNLVPDNQMQVPDMWDVRPTGTSEAMWSMQNNSAGDWNSRGLFKFAVASKTTGYTGQESDFFPVKPGAKYRAATQVYASDLSKVNNIFRVLWYDVNKTLLSYNDWFNGVPTTQFNTSTVTAPSGVAYATAAFYVFQDNTTVDAFYAGVFVAEQNAASLIVDGGITTNLLAANSITVGLIAAGAVTADKLAARSVTAKSLVLTDATNLVPDNQIQDAASWGYAGTGPQSSWFMTANGPPWQSAGIFKYDLTQKTTGFTGRISQRFPVKGGKTYRLSGQCWNNNETTATFNVLIRVDWLDLSEQFIVSSYILNYGGPGSSLPLTSVVTVAAPGNAARAQYAIYVNQDATTASGVWFGGPIVREMNAAELIVDGGIITNMLAADSVTADKIQVNSLEAISATLGNVVVNGALIQDATIVNAKTGPLFVGCVT